MSYGLKYNLVFRDSTTISNMLWQVNLFSNGYSGTTKQMIGADSPIQISYKKQNLETAINGSELTLLLYATTTSEYDEFLTAEPLQYYIQIQNSNDGGITWGTYWSGVNTTDTFTQAHSNAPYQVSVKFNCGLGELQWHRYENAGSLMTQAEQVSQLIANCFSFLPYTLNIREIVNVREDTMLDTKGLFEQLYVNDTAFYEIGSDGLTHGINCNKLLNYILTSINCRMYQANNMWFVERIYERINTTVNYFDYYGNSSFQTANTQASYDSGTLNWTRTIHNASYPKITKGSEKAVTQKQPILTYNFSTSSIPDLQLIPNPFFENIPTARDSFGRPLRWDRSTDIQSLGGDKLETIDPYESDPKYQSGYSFGTAVVNANKTWIDTNTPLFPVNPPPYGGANPSPYNIHAVRNPNDTYTSGYVILDPANMQMVLNFKHYISILFSPNYTSMPTYSQATKDANAILLGYPAGIIPLKIFFKQQSNGQYYFLDGQQQIAGSANATWLKSTQSLFTIQFLFSSLNQFPYQANTGGTLSGLNANGGMTLSDMTSYIINSWSPATNTCTPFSIMFNTSSSYTIGFNPAYNTPFPNLPQPYYFDCVAQPVYMMNAYTANINTIASVSDFAIKNIDLELKDSAQTATSNISFYSTADEDLRWNELTVNAFIGDTDSAGYPGSFSVSSGLNTTGWHNIGVNYLFDNGTTNADPGTGKFRFDNAILTSVAHIYINRTDNGGNNQNALLAAIVSGQNLLVKDYVSGATAAFVTGTPVSHSTYYDIPVTVVLTSGVFTNLNSCYLNYQSGTLLADIFFQNFAQIPATYRSNLRGNVIYDSVLQYFHSVEDEDGTLYIQLGHTFEIKQNKYSTDMEGMADLKLPITPIHGSPTTGWVSPTVLPVSPKVPIGISSHITTTPIKAISMARIIPNTAYPL